MEKESYPMVLLVPVPRRSEGPYLRSAPRLRDQRPKEQKSQEISQGEAPPVLRAEEERADGVKKSVRHALFTRRGARRWRKALL